MTTAQDPDIRIVADGDALAEAGARLFAGTARAAIAARGVCRVALSGGSTPRALYRLLAESSQGRTAPAIVDPVSLPPEEPAVLDVDWSRVRLFFGDERFVPADHPDSNYRMVRETGLAGPTVPEAQVFRVPTELGDAQSAADRYAETLRAEFGTREGEWPRFDLVLLGMGEDGHTASLFPGTAVLEESRRIVAAVWVEKVHTWRVTLTLPVINAAREVVLLVGGAGKAAMLARVLGRAAAAGADAASRPVQRVRPGGRSPIWLVDRAAAADLPPAQA